MLYISLLAGHDPHPLPLPLVSATSGPYPLIRRKWRKEGVIQDLDEEVWCSAAFTHSTEIAEAANKAKPTKTFEEMVPEHYRKFEKVFSEKESERLPAHKPWDHHPWWYYKAFSLWTQPGLIMPFSPDTARPGYCLSFLAVATRS